MITVILPWPAKELSPNSRVHWAKKAKAAKAAKSIAFYICLRSINPVSLFNQVSHLGVSLTFHPADNRRRDLDNAISSCKSYLDGISAALKVDDSRFKLSAQIGPVKRPACVIVEIT